MNTDLPGANYQIYLFLKDASHRERLVPKTWLYGQINHRTKTIFMSPYEPPNKAIPWVGIVQEKSDTGNLYPTIMNVFVDGDSLIACGRIQHEYCQIPIRVIYQAACYERTPFNPFEMNLLGNTTVLIFGAGTGGGKIAVELARAGVGHIIIVDPEPLEWANISRHEGDLFDIGKSKAQIIAEKIYKINPTIKITIYAENIFDWPIYNINQLISKKDLVIAATDKTDVQLLINEFTHKLRVPAVFGGCYEEAHGGEVFYTLPGEEMPCLSCLRSGMAQPRQNNNIDYSTAIGPEDYQGQPGLHAMVDFVTCTEILISLAILFRDIPGCKLSELINPKRNFLLVGGALGAGFYRFKKPFDVFFQPLSGPRKNCITCSKPDASALTA